MVDAFVPVVAALLGLTALFKLAMLRRQFIPAQAALAGAFVALTIGVLQFTPVFQALVGNPLSGTSLADVIGRNAVLVAAMMAQLYLLLLAHDLRVALLLARWRIALAILALVVMWTLVLVTPDASFASRPMDHPAEAAIYLTFFAHLVFALSDVARSAYRWSSSCQGAVRHGLRLITAGSLLGVLYSVMKAMTITTDLTGVPLPREVSTVLGRSLALAGLTLVALGSVLPSIHAMAAASGHLWRSYRAYGALYPLWADLVAWVPGIALERPVPRWRDRLRIRDLDLRLYRRIIELRDGELAVRSASTNGILGMETSRARILRSAMQSAERSGAVSPNSSSSGSVADEIAWWIAVSLAYAHPEPHAMTSPSRSAA